MNAKVVQKSAGKGGPKNYERNIKFTEEMSAAISQQAETEERSFPEIVRRAVALYLGDPGLVAAPADGGLALPLLSSPPTSPLTEAVDAAPQYLLSSHVAQSIEAKQGDFLFQVSGNFLKGEGIVNGSLLLVRPVRDLMPADDELALAQLVNGQSILQCRLGRWKNGRPPQLLAPAGEEPYKVDSQFTLRPIGVVRGVISRIA